MRFEITINDTDAMPAAIDLLRRSGVRQVNVTDTSRIIDPVGISLSLLGAVPSLDVMTHVAAKHHDADSFMKLVERAAAGGIRKLLVVSGHPRTGFDSLAALDMVAASGLDIDIYCVYNPFLEGDARRDEDDRLGRKLEHGFVRGVCFQMGSDLAAIARGAKLIRSMQFDAELLGSVATPTDAMLKRLRAKPLFGVALPEGYFASTSEAQRITAEVLSDLDAYDIEPLLFFADLDGSSLDLALAML